MNNNKVMKKILATASTFAMLATGVSAMAEPTNRTTAGDAALNNGAKLSVDADWDPAGFVSGDIVLIGAANHDLDIDQAKKVSNIKTNGFDGRTATINVDGAELGGVSGDEEFNITFGGGHTLTLDGADNEGASKYSALNKVDFNDNAATLALDAGDGNTLTLSGVEFRSDAANNGTINVVNNAVLENATFAPGPDTVNQIKVAEGKTLTLSGDTDLDNLATDLNLANNGSSLVVNDKANARDVTLAAEDTALTLKGTDNNDKANAGNVTVTAGGKNSTVLLEDHAQTGNVTLEAAGANLTLKKNSEAGTANLNHAEASVDLYSGTLTAVDANAEDNGTINVKGNANIGRIGATERVKLLHFASKGDEEGELTLGAGGAHSVKDITTNRDRKDTLKLNENLTVSNAIGGDENGIKIQFDTDNTLQLDGQTFNADLKVAKGETRGTAKFTNEVTVKGKLGSGEGLLETVSISGADANVTLGDSLHNVQTLSFDHEDAQASLSSVANKDMKIDAANAHGHGKLTLNNESEVTIGELGATNRLGSVTLAAAGGLKVKEGAFRANNLVFGENASESTIVRAANFNDTAITTEKSGNGVIEFTGNWTLANDVATKDKRLNHVTYTGKNDADLDVVNHGLHADIFASNVDKLSLKNLGTGDNSTHYALGSEGARLKSVDFGNVGADKTASVTGQVFAKDLTLSNVGTVKFSKNLTGGKNNDGAVDSTLHLNNDNAKAVLASDVSIVDMNVKTDGNNRGTLVFEGSSNVTTNFGEADHRLNFVSMAAADKTVELHGVKIYANQNAGNDQGITLGAGTLDIKGDSTLDGYVDSNNTTIDLHNHTFTLTSGANIKSTTLNLEVEKNGSVLSNGSIVVNDAVTLDHTKGFSLNISSGLLDEDDKFTVAVFDALSEADKKYLENEVSMNDINLLNDIEVSEDDLANNKLTFTVVAPNLERYQKALRDHNSSENVVTALSNFVTHKSDLSSAARDLLRQSSNPAKIERVAKEVSRAVAAEDTSSESSNMIDEVADSSSMRLSSVSTSAGVASGENDTSMNVGVWATPFYSRGDQKVRNGNVGYKSRSVGMTLGADTMVSDSTTIGLAATYAGTNLDFKGEKTGDKKKVNNVFLNAYARHDLNNNWFLQGVVGFGKGKVKEENIRNTHLDESTTLNADYDRVSFNVEGRAGYNYALSDCVSLVPEAGLRYSVVNDAGYTEKGDAVLAKKVSKEASDRLTALLGATFVGRYDLSGTEVRPEIHANLGYDVHSKNPKVTSEMGGIQLDTTPGKAARFKSNVGVGVNAVTDNFEYGIAYDAKFASKYVSHQGTLKLRVNL